MKVSRRPISASNRALLAVVVLAGLGLGTALAAPVPGARRTFANSAPNPGAARAATMHAMLPAHLTDQVGFNLPLTLRNRAELEARINRGEVLTGEELKAKYFPLRRDFEAVAAFLRREGFTVDPVADTTLAVFAHGTVAQVQSAFQVNMGLVTADDGTRHAAALTAPSLPAAVAGPVLGVSGLSYRRPKNRLAHPTAGGRAGARDVPGGGYHIDDITKVYSGYGLSVAGQTLTGAGQIIAIEAYTTLATSDYTTFWQNNGVARTGALTFINAGTTTVNPPSQDPGDAEEAALDIEWAGGIAPGADLQVYATTYEDNDSAERIYNRAISDGAAAGNPIRQFTSSYGPTEAEMTAAELSAYDQIFLSMTAEGMTFVNATGDIGSGTWGTLQPEAYGVFPYVLGVGGTTLQLTSPTSDVRSTETGWSGSSGGLSTQFARPAWQVGDGIGTGSATGTTRLFPDIALAADPDTGADYVAFGSDSEVGGTSWGAPTFAGFLALIHQGRALNTPSRLGVGFLNPRIYPLIGTANFFDVTSGNNGAYNATTGYDLVTGVGVPTISNLLATLLGPTITGLSPASGPAGTSVTITGTNFYANGTAYPVTVSFGGTTATSVMVASATQLTAVVPDGAATGAVVVTSFGDAATSPGDFIVGTPDLTVASTHAGNFTQADTGDTYTLTVANAGTAATGGTVTFTDTLPGGLTATAMSGPGWTCDPSTLTATCSDALAAGGSYPAITLTVSVAANAPANVANGVAISGGGETNTANDTGTDPTTINALTPSQSWRYQYFGMTDNGGNAADTANPAGDGLNNLTKYALGLDPTMPEVNPATADTSTGYLRLTVPKNANATDLTYRVQVTSDLTDPTSWTTDGTTIDQNTATTLQVQDNTPVSGTAMRFIRLQISR